MTNPNENTSLFRIENLRVGFGRDGVVLDAVRGINLELKRREVLGIVGESGSGKSIGMLASIGLTPPNAKVSGSVTFQGEELVGKSRREMRSLRGSKIAMIFQDPLSSLNPVMKVGDQLIEALQLHQKSSPESAMARAIELRS